MAKMQDLAFQWLPMAAFFALLLGLAAAEAFSPIHAAPAEPKGRLTTNFGLGMINLGLLAFAGLSSVAGASWAEAEDVGLLNRVGAPASLAFALTIVARSLANYAIHRACHAAPLLWRLHRVHHCDPAIDLSTGVRHHPLEVTLVAAVLGAGAIVLGASVGALMIYEAVALAWSLWSHSNLRIPAIADRWLGAVFVTPAQHHVHHSAHRAETDSNFGEVFNIWDRIFATFQRIAPDALARLRVGLGEADDRTACDMAAQLAAPFTRSRQGGERRPRATR